LKLTKPVVANSLLSEHDIYLFREGSHTRLYDRFGAHATSKAGQAGFQFGVWAPNADKVSVVGDFNHWQAESHVLHRRADNSGVWEGFIAGPAQGDSYKFRIKSRSGVQEKADPFARQSEEPPRSASRLCTLDYTWNDS
jgi:1,4-alpha-glucan branching enzyme